MQQIIDEYLEHIKDIKLITITARQCIKQYDSKKTELKDDIVSVLQRADVSILQTVCDHWCIMIFKILWKR